MSNHNLRRPSLTWTLFLLVLFTTQLRESDAGVSFKLKKLLKKVLLLRALSPKKSLAIIPIPIPLSLLKKDKMMDMFPKMPEHMPHPPMYMPGSGAKMMGHEMLMPSASYGMMRIA